MSKAQRALHDPLRSLIAQALERAQAASSNDASSAPLTERVFYEGLSEPPNPDLGDFAFGCFVLAKAWKMNPAAAALELARRIETGGLISSAQAAGPYVNVTLNQTELSRHAIESALSGKAFERTLLENAPRTMVEFSQPNTHKEIHVGHMRNLALGDAIVRLQRYAGVDVVSSTFPGDVGTHVAKCLWYLKFRNQEPIPESGRGEWLGKLYSLGHLALEEERGTEKEAVNRDQLTAILKQIEAKQGEFHDLWAVTRQWSIDLMKSTYSWAGVTFDRWYWESEVDSASVALVKRLFAEGKLVQSEGAIGMDLEADKLGFCLLLKSDGTGLYATKDLELARRKFEEMKIGKSLYVVDQRQALHFKQVFKVLERLGFKQSHDCVHLPYNFVELPDGAMSSRKGNIVPIMELIEKMEAFVKERYLSRYAGDWTQPEIDSTAREVAQGAIKYGMLRMDTNKKIVFDMEEWLKLDGESGPFIQYSHARVSSLCQKLAYDPSAEVDWREFREPAERRLTLAISSLNTAVALAAETFRPALVCAYLYELAKAFNVFYHECPIGTAPSAGIKTARLALAAASGKTMQVGLGLLGIPAPRRM